MPFLRYARDKRGYEHVYLVQPVGKRGKIRPRILYWFRTPPGVRVGRDPFDADARRAIEAQYPDVEFDWPKLLATPKPPPQTDVERWRERRRQVKAEKAALAAERDESDAPVEAEEVAPSAEVGDVEPEVEELVDLDEVEPAVVAAVEESAVETASADPSRPADATAGGDRKRRRRRRRRHKLGGGEAAVTVAGAAASPDVYQPDTVEQPSRSGDTPTIPRPEGDGATPDSRSDYPATSDDE